MLSILLVLSGGQCIDGAGEEENSHLCFLSGAGSLESMQMQENLVSPASLNCIFVSCYDCMYYSAKLLSRMMKDIFFLTADHLQGLGSDLQVLWASLSEG